jgi:sulfate permease, SulP family
MLGLLEAVAMAKAIAVHSGQKLNITQQCLSESVANISGSFFQCMPGSGSLTRSAVNQQAGAVSQWSGVFSAVAVATTIVCLAPFASLIPKASLAGLLMLAAFRMVDFRQLIFHLRATRFDALIVIATAAAAVFVSIEFCVLIGALLSFVLYVPRMAWVRLTECHLTADQVVRERLPADPRCGRILLFSLEGELSFGTALELQTHLETIEQQAGPDARVVLLFLKRARNPDASFMTQIGEFHQRLQKRKIHLILCGVREDLAKALHSTRLDAQIPPECILLDAVYPNSNTADAMDRAYRVLGLDRCPICPRHADQQTVDTLDYII